MESDKVVGSTILNNMISDVLTEEKETKFLRKPGIKPCIYLVKEHFRNEKKVSAKGLRGYRTWKNKKSS